MIERASGEHGRAAGELTPRIGRVATRELAAYGITTYAELARHPEREILAVHGLGPKAIRILSEELARRRLRFAD
ncbi:hypothetical protein QL996_08495 [Planococcus sp. APC 4015]|nr:hypothetical protein [Planococcus sp. APC 4015]